MIFLTNHQLQGLIIIWLFGLLIPFKIVIHYFYTKAEPKMDLGTTIAVFILVAGVLMLSFCLLLKFYSYQLRRQLMEHSPPELLEQSLYRSNEQIINGAYDEFRERRQLNRQVEMKQISGGEDKFIQNSDIRQILDLTNDIYAISKIRKKLNDEIPPLAAETTRSNAPLKSFNFSRMDTAQTQKQKKFYSFVQKIVAYNDKGLTIIETLVKSIKKEEGEYQLAKEVECKIEEPSQHFCDRLESQGFYPNCYGYYKYVSSIDVTYLKEQETVQAKALIFNSSKEEISQEDFKQLKSEMLG